MMKLTVLYTPPTDPAAFDEHYLSVHMPLAGAMPGLARAETALVTGAPGGGDKPYHRIAELYWADAEAMNASLASEEGVATAKDAIGLAKRTGSTVTMFVSELDEA